MVNIKWNHMVNVEHSRIKTSTTFCALWKCSNYYNCWKITDGHFVRAAVSTSLFKLWANVAELCCQLSCEKSPPFFLQCPFALLHSICCLQPRWPLPFRLPSFLSAFETSRSFFQHSNSWWKEHWAVPKFANDTKIGEPSAWPLKSPHYNLHKLSIYELIIHD